MDRSTNSPWALLLTIFAVTLIAVGLPFPPEPAPQPPVPAPSMSMRELLEELVKTRHDFQQRFSR